MNQKKRSRTWYDALTMPLLLLQGIYTRIATPKLHEPKGPRRGVEGQGERLSLLILGDSSAAGVGADQQEKALSGQLVTRLKRQFEVHWQLMAWTGAKARDLVGALPRIDPKIDLVVLVVGVNDVTGRTPIEQWLAEHDQLLEHFGGQESCQILISTLPPMGLFPALPRLLRSYMGKRAQLFDQERARWAQQQNSVTLVPMVFEGSIEEVVALDGFHPGPKAYSFWADHLAEAIFSLNCKSSKSTIEF